MHVTPKEKAAGHMTLVFIGLSSLGCRDDYKEDRLSAKRLERLERSGVKVAFQ